MRSRRGSSRASRSCPRPSATSCWCRARPCAPRRAGRACSSCATAVRRAVPVQLGVVSENEAEVLAGLESESDGDRRRRGARGGSGHGRARGRGAREPRVMRLADASIRRPVFAVMLVGGARRARRRLDSAARHRPLPARRVPDRHGHAPCSGAAPETMEREVTQILEESINTIEGIRTLSSQSSDSLSMHLHRVRARVRHPGEGAGGARQGRGGERRSAARRRGAGGRPRRSRRARRSSRSCSRGRSRSARSASSPTSA